jgi:hypothetical protein
VTAVSCRPARLVRFEGNVDASIEGLSIRMRALLHALDQYVASCDPAYVVPGCRDVVDALRQWRSEYQAFGRWTGDVGRAVLAVDAIDHYTDVGGLAGGDDEDVVVVDTWRLLGELGRHRTGDLLLGVPYRPTGYPRLSDNGDGPPKWLASVNKGSTYFDVAAGLMKWAGTTLPDEIQLSAALRVSRTATTLTDEGGLLLRSSTWELAGELSMAGANGGATRLGTWLGRAGAALAFAGGFASQWIGDTDMPTSDRLLRATERGGGIAIAALAMGKAGAAYGTSFGPEGTFIGGLLGSAGGAILGDAVLDQVLPGHRAERPGALDRESVVEAIGHPDADASATRHRVGLVDLAGWNVARSDPAIDSSVRVLVGQPTYTQLSGAPDPGTPTMTPTATTTLAPP